MERHEWGESAVDRALFETCITCKLADAAQVSPNKIAVQFGDQSLTFRDLHLRALATADALRAAGIGRGDVVGASSYNSLDYVVLFFGCHAAGIVWSPLNVALTEHEVTSHLVHLRPAAIAASSEMAASVKRASEELGVDSLAIENLVPTATEGSTRDHECLTGHDSAWIIFSGATTGHPKAIELPAAWAAASTGRVMDAVGLREDDIVYSVLQMYHAWQSLHVLIACVTYRCTVVMRRWFSASEWLDDARRVGATVVDPLAAMIGAILAQPVRPDDADNPIRIGVNGVTDGTDRTIRNRTTFLERFGIPTVNIYGLTEAGAAVGWELQSTPEPNPGLRPSDDYDVLVADEHGWPCAPGEVGEVLVRPRFPGIVAKGYAKDGEKTVASWRDLWIHTGDRARTDDDGNIAFVGRDAFWIRRRGENLSAGEVENAIRELSGVADVAVIGVDGELGEQEILAFIEPIDGSEVAFPVLHEQLAERLAYFKMPRFYQLCLSLPRTAKGDVMRHHLQRDQTAIWDTQEKQRPGGR